MEKYFDINNNGHSIRCKLYCNDPRNYKKIIVCGHGFAGHKDNKATSDFAEVVLSKKKDVAILAFDWPAHGQDVKKKLLLEDCNTYLGLVIEYCNKELGVTDIKGYANSFGAFVYLDYIAKYGNPFTKVALRSPAITIYDSLMNNIMTKENLEAINKGRAAQVGFDRKTTITQEYIDELKASDVRKNEYIDEFEKILILHGDEDEIIDFNAVKQFADDNLIEFVTIEGGDHRFMRPAAMGTARKHVIEFLDL